jgi:hypothetical protein
LADWNDLPYSTKLALVDYWTVFIIVGNFLHCAGLILYLLPDKIIRTHYESGLIGMGTFLLYLSVLKYIQSSDELYTLPKTMIFSGGVILNALISSLPIMIATSIFCMTFFGDSYRFRTLDSSLIMLWSSMNGDEL